TSFTLYMR
nr:RecName: Full=Uncharacterized protein SMPP11 [Nautilus macromphalus]